MLIPRYYFADDFRDFYDYFLSAPHRERSFHKGEHLWRAGEPHENIHYIISGAEIHFAVHENGHRKIISFHGPGTVFPGYHRMDYRIELSLETVAMADMSVLEFSVDQFSNMFEENTALGQQVVNWYSMYVNLLLFENIHQEFNPSQIRLCNLLYLLSVSQPANSGLQIEMTQEELADILGMSRVQITRELTVLRGEGILATKRGGLLITDLPKLAALCSKETI